MDCSLPGSYVRKILRARTLERVAAPSSRALSRPTLSIAKYKFVCPMPSKDQTNQRSGAEWGLCKVLQGDGWLIPTPHHTHPYLPKNTQIPEGFLGKHF